MTGAVTAASRAEGALTGLAVGDALGMPTQLRSRADVVARHGRLLEGFVAAPDDHPIAAGLAAGTVTDDTEQAVLLGRLLVAGSGRVEPAVLAGALLAWEADVAERGSSDLLGPSTAGALAALAAGRSPEEAGRYGTTDGAAMRIAPVGIATPPARTSEGPAAEPGRRWAPLVERVVAVSRLTHNTGLALAGAAAVAAAVSAAVEGESLPSAIAAALEAAGAASTRGYWVAGADVAARIGWAVELVSGLSIEEATGRIVALVGTSLATQEAVPAAFAVLAAVPDDPWTAVRVAASLGGDTDTIAAMVGAVTGARHGVEAWPTDAREVVRRQGFALEELAAGLLALREATPEPTAAVGR